MPYHRSKHNTNHTIVVYTAGRKILLVSTKGFEGKIQDYMIITQHNHDLTNPYISNSPGTTPPPVLQRLRSHYSQSYSHLYSQTVRNSVSKIPVEFEDINKNIKGNFILIFAKQLLDRFQTLNTHFLPKFNPFLNNTCISIFIQLDHTYSCDYISSKLYVYIYAYIYLSTFPS